MMIHVATLAETRGNKNMMSKEERIGVDQKYMQRHFDYDDGKLIRKESNGPGSKIGHWGWSINRHGYRKIKIKQATFEIHRLIWVMFNGYIPVGLQVDHINRDRLDNRIENLRLVTHRQNAANNSRNMSGVPGIHWNKFERKWQAFFKLDGKTITVGRYKDFDEACAAKDAAMREMGIAVCY